MKRYHNPGKRISGGDGDRVSPRSLLKKKKGQVLVGKGKGTPGPGSKSWEKKEGFGKAAIRGDNGGKKKQ